MNLARTITLAEHIKVRELTIERSYPEQPWVYDENMNRRYMGVRQPPDITVTFLVSRQHLPLLKEQAKSHRISVMVDDIPGRYKGSLDERVTGYASMWIYSLHLDEYCNDGNVFVTARCSEIDIQAMVGGE